MRNSRFPALCVLLLASTLAVQAEVKNEIESAGQKFSEAYAKGDAAALAAMYTEDAQLMPPNAEPLRGREAIRKYWQGALDSGMKHLKLETLEVFGQGEITTEVGTYTALDAAEKVLERGKFIVVWKREDGQWRILRDMFSSNAPSTDS